MTQLNDSVTISAVNARHKMVSSPGGVQGQGKIAKECHCCGQEHVWDKMACPVWGKQCSLCKKFNHLRAKCYKLRGVQSLATETTQEPQELQLNGKEREKNVFTVQVKQINSVNLTDEQTVTLRVREKHYIRFQLNSGADCNVLLVHVYKVVTSDQHLQKVKSSAVSLSGFGKQNVQTVGQVLLRVWCGETYWA